MDCADAKALTKSLDFPDCQIKSILLERGVKLEDLTILGHLTTTPVSYTHLDVYKRQVSHI